MTLTTKEANLLKDLRTQEQLCVEKYDKYASNACSDQLKQLFLQIGKAEAQHVQTLDKLISCEVPQMTQSSEKDIQSVLLVNNAALKSQDEQNFYSKKEDKDKDKYLCTDALSTEKHVSGIYDTCIFEFSETNIREALNHIQKEEQQHGEHIYHYMSQCGMYS